VAEVGAVVAKVGAVANVGTGKRRLAEFVLDFVCATAALAISTVGTRARSSDRSHRSEACKPTLWTSPAPTSIMCGGGGGDQDSSATTVRTNATSARRKVESTRGSEDEEMCFETETATRCASEAMCAEFAVEGVAEVDDASNVPCSGNTSSCSRARKRFGRERAMLPLNGGDGDELGSAFGCARAGETGGGAIASQNRAK
jgi:hypothetical protein